MLCMYCRYYERESDGRYVVKMPKPSEWFHAVVTYHGLGNGITVYHDVTQVRHERDKIN